MTTRFVSAVDGSNADNGTTWALAKQTVSGALAISSAGDVIVVDNAGTFTAGAAITWTPPAGGIAIISVLRSGASSFTWAAGAAELVGAANGAFIIAPVAGASIYVYGMTIKSGTNNNTACSIGLANTGTAYTPLEMYNCTFDLPNAAATVITLGNATTNTALTSPIRLINCIFNRTGSNTGNYLNMNNGKVEIINPTVSFTGASKPANLIQYGNTVQSGTIAVRNGDISGFTGTAIVSVTNLNSQPIVLENLSLHATPTLTSGSWPGGTGSITVRNCDSDDTTYVFQYINAYGTLTADTSVYVTSGGAVFNGAGASWKIVTTAACNEAFPFVTPALFVWDTTLTAQTSAIEFIRDNATALTDRDIWSDLDFAASASLPNYTNQTNRNANPFTGTAADQPTSTIAWTGTGGFSNPTKQKLQNGFTAAETGLLQARISVGVASTTLYIDPFIGGVG